MIFLPKLETPGLPPAPPLRPGGNVRVGSNALGMWIEGPGSGGGDFRHPFLVTGSGAVCRVASGLVIGNIAVEPVIGGVPLGGDSTRRAPVLRIDAGLVNSAGESWVCVEVTPDADGLLAEEPAEPQVVVVQRAHPVVTQGDTGRAPLAMLVFRKGRGVQIYQVAFFHLRYETSRTGAAARKHFFL